LFICRWGRTLFQCPNCWLLPRNCVCSKLQHFHPTTKIILHYHHDEWSKGSNTGCITHRSLIGSEMLMRGHKDHDARLQQLMSDPTITKAILWPGPQGLTPQQLQQRAAEQTQGRLAVIALDSTWDNANRMRSKLPPDVPQLQLPPDLALSHGSEGSLFAPLRKYSKEAYAQGRVCTLEAVAATLLALEPDGVGEEMYEGLLNNLKVKVDAMRRQKNMATVYDTL
jgi:DTW domain-containing protein YfiP